MFKLIIILYARRFWVTECTPNPGWSFPHWPGPMLELKYGPLAACWGLALGGREAGRRGNADGLGAREGGNTLRSATLIPPLCHAQTASFPTPLHLSPMTAGAPPRRRPGRNAAPAARRTWRHHSRGWAASRT